MGAFSSLSLVTPAAKGRLRADGRKTGRLKNGTIAKLAAQVSEYYASAEQSANKVRLAAGDDWPNFGFPDVRLPSRTPLSFFRD